MSALQGLSVPAAGLTLLDIAAHFWKWFRAHEGDSVVHRRILFFTLTIRVRDLRFLFEQLFGPEVIA